MKSNNSNDRTYKKGKGAKSASAMKQTRKGSTSGRPDSKGSARSSAKGSSRGDASSSQRGRASAASGFSRPSSRGPASAGSRNEGRPQRPEGSSAGFEKRDRPSSTRDSGRYERSERRERPAAGRDFGSDERGQRRERPSSGRDFGRDERGQRRERPAAGRDFGRDERGPKRERPATGRDFGSDERGQRRERRDFDRDERARRSEKPSSGRGSSGGSNRGREKDYSIRLNKFIAHSGICSRREADTLIQTGAISVNGKLVTEVGTKVNPGDIVKYGDQRLVNEKKVYLLLNKPKDFITTSDDPQERKTVIDLIKNACPERVYPVGRLDRNTTGLLLLTNDGDLAKKLTHPRHGVSKIYHVHLDKPLTKADMAQIAQGVELEDVTIVPDAISYVEGNDSKKEVGIQIHSGQNRVVRRIFEKLGYDVVKLDRVSFAGLTKKDLPRGKWRFLSEKEVNFLRMLK